MRPRDLPRHLQVEGASRGPVRTAATVLGWGARYAVGLPLAGRPGGPSFEHDGARVPYLRHRYNHTWLTERAVEVPLALRVLQSTPSGRVLEVGNVLRHYRPLHHEVVDKYERAPGVVNADVADVDLSGGYDLVLSLSTLEHVGFDEDDRDPDKPRRVVERLAGGLRPGGLLWATLPVGYNRHLDEQLRAGALPFTRMTALRRVSWRNRWRSVPLDDVWDAPYDRLVWTATGLVVAELRAPR